MTEKMNMPEHTTDDQFEQESIITPQTPLESEQIEHQDVPVVVEYEDISHENLDSILESILFVSEKPLQKSRVHEVLREINPELIDQRLEQLCEKHCEGGFQLVKINSGYQFRTHPDNSDYLLRLNETKPIRLSRANLETLAIVAYRQPITRPEVDEIRGVDSGHMMRTLLERNLIKILGKREEAGNPLIYGTTPEFLQFFQIDTLSDLPSLTEYTELGEESLQKLEKLLPQPTDPDSIEAVQETPDHEQTSLTSEPIQKTERPAEDVHLNTLENEQHEQKTP